MPPQRAPALYTPPLVQHLGVEENDWETRRCTRSGRIYYANRRLKTTTWTKPFTSSKARSAQPCQQRTACNTNTYTDWGGHAALPSPQPRQRNRQMAQDLPTARGVPTAPWYHDLKWPVVLAVGLVVMLCLGSVLRAGEPHLPQQQPCASCAAPADPAAEVNELLQFTLHVGQQAELREDYAAAVFYYEKGHALMQKFGRQNPTMADLAHRLELNLASAHHAAGALAEADVLYRRTLAWLEQDTVSRPDLRREVMRSLLLLYKAEGRTALADALWSEIEADTEPLPRSDGPLFEVKPRQCILEDPRP